MHRIGRIYDLVEAGVALLALALTVGSVLAAGIGRSIGSPVSSAAQFALLFLIWACVLGADLAMKRSAHIRVSSLVDAMPTAVGNALGVFNLVLVALFLAVLVFYGWDLAVGNWQRELGASGLSYGLVTLALPVGATLLLISLIRRAVVRGPGKAFIPDEDVPESIL